jgi:hypothetical protein
MRHPRGSRTSRWFPPKKARQLLKSDEEHELRVSSAAAVALQDRDPLLTAARRRQVSATPIPDGELGDLA